MAVKVSLADESDERDKHKGATVGYRPRVDTDDGTRLRDLGFSPVAAMVKAELSVSNNL